MSLSNLQSKKILLDFKHAKEELELKRDMIAEIDTLFNEAVAELLKNNAILKNKWEALFKTNISDENTSTSTELEKPSKEKVVTNAEPEVNSTEDNSNTELELEPEVEKNKKEDPFTSVYKMVYREIVKRTHPDKISHLSEEEQLERVVIYREATKAYEKKDIGELLYCAYQAKVTFKVSDQEIFSLKSTVEKYKKESSFLEQTYSWKWFHSDDITKRMLVEKFILHQINLS